MYIGEAKSLILKSSQYSNNTECMLMNEMIRISLSNYNPSTIWNQTLEPPNCSWFTKNGTCHTVKVAKLNGQDKHCLPGYNGPNCFGKYNILI